MIFLKSRSEIAAMRESGRLVARVLAAVAEAARPGVRLIELDELAAGMIDEAGALSSFRNYQPGWAPMPYPGVLCLSVNDAIVHGIPNGTVLQEGDLLSIDFGAAINGLHADAAITVPIGTVDAKSTALSDATARALAAGIEAARPGNRVGDISHAVESVCRAAGYGMPLTWGGHGIGRAMHEEPHVPNHGPAGRGLLLRAGLVIAIEPQFIAGGQNATRTADDGWTILTTDGSRAAHFEHTIAITEDGPVVLTVA